MNSISIYTKLYTERQAYVFEFIFDQVLGIPYKVFNADHDFIQDNSFKINYSSDIIKADLQLVPHGLLFEKDIKPQTIDIHHWQSLPIFFSSPHPEIPFDLFSAIFYLISRYEEYLPYSPDEYQRYPHKLSIAFKQQFLHQPLVDQWIQTFKKELQRKNSNLVFKEAGFTFLPTYDIDIAYSYIGKSFPRQIAGMAKDFLHGHFSKLKDRLLTLLKKQTDPYDSYLFLNNLHQQHALKPLYFFLVGEQGPLDKNISFHNKHFQSLFKEISARYPIGLHPSFQSHQSKSILEAENAKLQTQKSRQHYIRFSLPNTYQNLIDIGITEDYSMGYGSINGFRASTSFPFYWFDLSKNEKTSLQIFPFCYMECNSFYEQQLSKEEAYKEMLHYYHAVKNTGGNLITIWHNFSLGNDDLWRGWKEIYEQFIQVVCSKK